jgi:hypothetical protein
VVGAEMLAASDWGLGLSTPGILNADVMLAALAVIGAISFSSSGWCSARSSAPPSCGGAAAARVGPGVWHFRSGGIRNTDELEHDDKMRRSS